MIWRALYLTLCSLALAGIVHIAIILLIPDVGTRDAYGVLSGKIEPLDFKVLEPKDAADLLSDMDPFFSYGVCRFDLSQAGLAMTGPNTASFWSATVVNQDGSVVYSLNNRTSIESRLDLILLSPLQILRLRQVQPPDIENAIIVESDMQAGFVLLRFLRPDETWDKTAESFFDGIRCRAYEPMASSAEQPVASNEAQ